MVKESTGNGVVDTKVWNSVSFICFNSSKDMVLILKRAKDDDSEPGKWCLPGGGVDAGESFEDSLFREVSEETNCEVGEYDYFKSIVVGTRLRVVFFFGSVADESVVKVNFEHSEFKWVKFENIKDYDFAFNQDTIIYEFLDAVGENLE
jgi:8-oxo-dGTP pyrophosphatase MutT (NUDIX family)